MLGATGTQMFWHGTNFNNTNDTQNGLGDDESLPSETKFKATMKTFLADSKDGFANYQYKTQLETNVGKGLYKLQLNLHHVSGGGEKAK